MRIERPLTLTERMLERFHMVRLTRRQRNERLAIVAMVVVMALYLVLRPILESFFRSAPSQPSAPAPAPGKKTDRSDRRGG